MVWPEGDMRDIRAGKSGTGPCRAPCAVVKILGFTLPERVMRKEGNDLTSVWNNPLQPPWKKGARRAGGGETREEATSTAPVGGE